MGGTGLAFETGAFLRERGLLDDAAVERIERDSADRIDDLVAAAEAYEADPASMFEHVYGTATSRIEEQHEYLGAFRDSHGDAALQQDG